MKSYYEILDLDIDASPKEIKHAYRTLVRKHHPDSLGVEIAEKSFYEIREAYEVLSDQSRRKLYDEENGIERKRQEKIASSQKKTAEEKRTKTAGASSSSIKQQSSILEEFAKRGASLNNLSSQRFSEASTQSQFKSFFESGAKSKGQASPNAKGLLDRLKGGPLFTRDEKKPKFRAERQSSQRTSPTSRIEESLRGERVFIFTIDALESLTGTSREIALDEENGCRRVRVKLPPGVFDNSVLKVECPETELFPARSVRVRVSIVPHALVERDGADIIVKIPITVGEAISGAELTIPTLDGPLRVTFPGGWRESKKLRLKGRGVQDKEGKGKGDLYVKTHIVIPDSVADSDAAREAAKTLDSLYTGNIRAGIPQKLEKEK